MDEQDIAKLYQDMETKLIDSLRRNLKRHKKEEARVGFKYPAWQAEKLKDLERIKKENAHIINKYTKDIPKDVKKILKEEYKQGYKREKKLFEDTKEGNNVKVNSSFFKSNPYVINALIDEVNGNLIDAKNSIFKMVNAKYRQTIFKANFFLAHGVNTLDEAIDMAVDEFEKMGLNCIEYKDGKRVKVENYAKMAIRTASQRAMLKGKGDFRKERGHALVIVTKHNTACKLCQKWENKVLIDDVYSGGKPDGKYKLLSEAMDAGLFHPNCRHGLPTYYPELDEVYDDIAKEEEEQNKKDLTLSKYESNNKKFKDILNKTLVSSKPNSGFVKDIDSFYLDGTLYKVDGEKIELKHSKSEKEITMLIHSIFGGEIYMLPEINTPQKEKMSDIFWNNERWDIKEISGNSKNKLSDICRKAKRQTNNFIFNINEESDYYKNVNWKREMNRIYRNKDLKHVNKIIIISNNRIIHFYKRK